MKKFAIIGVLAVFALSLMGFGFAKWSKSVNAEITVNTGGIALGIRDVGTNDDGTNTGVADFGISPFTNQLGADPQYVPQADYDRGIRVDNSEMKDVAKKVSANTGQKVFAIGTVDYYDAITETITNGYPYYGPTTVLEIASNGSVPVKIEELTATANGTVAANHHIGSWTIKESWDTTYTASGTGQDDLLAALKGIQLHEGYVITITMVEYIDQQAAQNASGTVTWQITASQWNEVL